MRSIAADVWVLTETDERLLPDDHMTAIISDTPERAHRTGERWVAIWTRGCHAVKVTTADPVRTACARLSWPAGRSLLIYGTVLPWRADRRHHPLRGADAFCHALAEQSREWRSLRQTFPDHILCVVGDFNQETERPCRVGTARGLQALEQALVDNQMVCLSGGSGDPLKRRTAGARGTIDHICVPASATSAIAAGPHCWPDTLRGLTDHFGTSVDLLLP